MNPLLFPALLKFWRGRQGQSQLDLALSAAGGAEDRWSGGAERLFAVAASEVGWGAVLESFGRPVNL